MKGSCERPNDEKSTTKPGLKKGEKKQKRRVDQSILNSFIHFNDLENILKHPAKLPRFVLGCGTSHKVFKTLVLLLLLFQTVRN